MSDVIGTLKEIAVKNAVKQEHQVDYLLEDAEVLGTVPFMPTTHGLHHMFEVVTDISGGGFVDMDAPPTEMQVETDLEHVDLQIAAGSKFIGQDKAIQFGGAPKYYADKEPQILGQFGTIINNAVIYNNLRQYALDHGTSINAGGVSDKNYCILAVTWKPGEVYGLYDPKFGGAKGKDKTLVQTFAEAGGNLVVHPDTKVWGFNNLYKAYIGMLLANPKLVGGIFNIDIDSVSTKIPTATQVDELLRKVRRNKNTYIYCHPAMHDLLADLGKNNQYRVVPGNEKDVQRDIEKWKGVKIADDFNFSEGLEADISFS